MVLPLDELQAAIARYDAALTQLQSAVANLPQTPLPVLVILAALTARDEVQAGLIQAQTTVGNVPSDWLHQVITLDEQLRLWGADIATSVDLAKLRQSINPAEDFWWWWFEPRPDPRDYWDWLWNSLTIAGITACGALLLEIWGKFLTITPGAWESLAILAPAAATLTTGGGVLTTAGKNLLTQAFDRLGIPAYYRQELRFGLTLVLFALLLSLHLSLPMIARSYSHQGEAALAVGDLRTAKTQLERSLALKPDYPRSQNLLGQVHQNLEQYDEANTAFQYATQAGYTPAWVGRSDVALAQENYADAEVAARRGLEQVTSWDDPDAEAELTYDLYVNLGWAQLQQDQAAAAADSLEQAIAIDPELATAHCILAEAQAEQNEPLAARRTAQLCLDYAAPDEINHWTMAAEARLQSTMPR